ncbi:MULTISPECIES: CRISPR-associated endonuclease Cas1 [Rhodobacterales]|uniref:CRISPR-associated endonuclease Cas1 n=1 Tax=Rhodobacterales TaxID=204455 RepID=UPI001108F744|nr:MULTISPECIES: CRISPR-associated endonuclease Cas1 [Rhodobacterales]
METLFVSKDAKLSADGATLLVRTAAGKKRVPIKGLSQIVLAGESGLTTSLITLLSREQVRIVVLDWHGNVSGAFEPAGSPRSGKVRQAQSACSSDPQKRLGLARRIVRGAGANILGNLRYRLYRGKIELKPAVEAVQAILADLESADSIEGLMGREGLMRAWYYGAWKDIDERLDFGPRIRRPPNNEINCLISWFNGLMYALCRNEIAKTHLDDCMSFLHSPMEARSSLALDLSEIFKPAICDGMIFEIALRGTNWDNWFEKSEGVCRLSETGRRNTLELWAQRVDRPVSGKPSLRDLIRSEALSIERHVLGVGEYRSWVRRV